MTNMCTRYSATMCMGWRDLLQACGEQDDIINTNRGSALRPLFSFLITVRPRSSNWQIAPTPLPACNEVVPLTPKRGGFRTPTACVSSSGPDPNKNRSIEETTRVFVNLGPGLLHEVWTSMRSHTLVTLVHLSDL